MEGIIGRGCPDVLKLSLDVLPPQGVVGDAGERGPPGPDGNEVRTLVRLLVNSTVLFFFFYPTTSAFYFTFLASVYQVWASLLAACPLSSVSVLVYLPLSLSCMLRPFVTTSEMYL